MIQQIDPLQYSLATYTINFIDDIYDKYERIAELRQIDIEVSVRQGMAAILSKENFFFHKMLKEVGFNYKLELTTIRDEYAKILPYIFGKTEVTFTPDYMKIGTTKFPHEGYNEYFPIQNTLIEYVSLAYIYSRVRTVNRKLKSYKDPSQIYFSVVEAAGFTGYAKSYLYKAKSEGRLKAHQSIEGGKLTFKREELEKFMFRHSSTTIEELI